ncbi:hypothetical protein ACFYUD_26500 [Nocardia tengchongensis]|uniref:hypothetical protein n=1 Tax=Nocardia tengchongensis TaxID=2055889 RepID=UPI0036B7EABA
MTGAVRYFIAGTMQGANRGVRIRNQDYRIQISDIVRRYHPDAECFDPHPAMRSFVRSSRIPLGLGFARLKTSNSFDEARASTAVLDLRDKFRELTAEAGRCDLVIAYLPGRVPSMGSAMEMYSAHLGGATVVSITKMRENLSVLSTSDVIVPDLRRFDSWLAGGPNIRRQFN